MSYTHLFSFCFAPPLLLLSNLLFFNLLLEFLEVDLFLELYLELDFYLVDFKAGIRVLLAVYASLGLDL